MRKRFESMSFSKMILVSCVMFLIIVVFIEFLFSLSKHNLEDTLAYMATPDFIIRKLVAAVIYGVIIAVIYRKKLNK